ncbi:MAG: hypothetical protein WBE44_04310 [Terriglobales bacterium]
MSEGLGNDKIWLMEIDELAREYQRKTDEELLQLARNKVQLTPEASSALDAELGQRRIGTAEELKTSRNDEEPSQGGQLRCLEQSEPYAHLSRKSQRLRKYRRFALAPFAAIVFAIGILRDPKNRLWGIPIALSVLYAGLIACYDLVTNLRMMSIRCPQCGKKFGGDDECFYCDLPRHSRS